MPTLVNAQANDATATAPTAAAAGTRRAAEEEPRADRQQRVRIDPTVATPGDKRSPLQAALLHVESHTASLHEGLSTLLLEKSKSILLQRHKIYSKTMTLSKLEKDETRIPASARIQFKLNVCKEVEDSNEFTELNIRNRAVTEEYTKKLKQHVIEAGKLEITNMKKHLMNSYATALHDVIAIYHVSQNVSSAKTNPTALKLIVESGPTILKHDSVDDFTEIYRNANNVGDLSQEQRDNINDRRIEITRTIDSIFIQPWDTYLQTYKEQELALSLKKHAREALLEQKTADATAVVDNELPADRTQLQDLIRAEALKIVKEANNPKSKHNRKNQVGQRRGAQKRNGNQSNRKKTPPRNQREQRRGPNADGGQQRQTSTRSANDQRGAGENNRGRQRGNSRNNRLRQHSRRRSKSRNARGTNGRQQS